MSWKKLLPSVIAGATAMAVAMPAAYAGKADDTLNIAIDRELESIDNYFNTAREGIIISRMVWDGLLYRDPETNKYKPNLATSYEWIDSKTLEFDLREGVTFHNGEKFDADDVVFTFNYMGNPDNGARPQRNVDWWTNAEKLGEYKVRLNLKEEFPAALEYLSGPVVMYPNEYYEKVGPEGMHNAPVGTGPYMVTSVETGKRYKFKKFDGYYAGSPKGKASIGNIDIRTIAESNTQLAELFSGGVDWIWKLKPDQAEQIEAQGQFVVKNSATMRVGYLNFDAIARHSENPMNDVRVRRAVAHAIDRQGIVDALIKGESTVVHSLCFPSQFGCTQSVRKYKYDPEKAKELLAEAGYPDGFEIPFLAYRNRDYAEAMISNLNAVGITTQFEYLKYAAFRDKVQSGNSPFNFGTWGSYSINDVSAITSHFQKGGKDDYSKDPEVIKQLEIGDSSINERERKRAYKAALSRIAEEVFIFPLWSYNNYYAFTKDLDFDPTPDEIPRFFTAEWE
jgi:peptide/nickel transport system substrate-binding protein